MPLGSGNIVQSNSGNTGTAAPTFVDVTVSPATAGNAVIIGITADESIITPSGFTLDASITESGVYHQVFRKQYSTGETSWTVSFGASAIAAWWVDEVSGLGSSPLIAGVTHSSATPVATISTGTTSFVGSADLLCIASWNSYNTSSTTVTFSGETNSFTEAHDTAGHWTTHYISIAEGRRFPGTSGSFESTATLSSSAQASGILVVYTATALPATVVDDVTVGGTFGLTAKVMARSGGDTHLDLFTGGTAVQGSIVLVSDLSVTGTMNYATSVIGVTASSVTFSVGDVVQSDATGECMVVRDAWSDDGPRWSNTTTRATIYTTSGWTVIGSASLM